MKKKISIIVLLVLVFGGCVFSSNLKLDEWDVFYGVDEWGESVKEGIYYYATMTDEDRDLSNKPANRMSISERMKTPLVYSIAKIDNNWVISRIPYSDWSKSDNSVSSLREFPVKKLNPNNTSFLAYSNSTYYLVKVKDDAGEVISFVIDSDNPDITEEMSDTLSEIFKNNKSVKMIFEHHSVSRTYDIFSKSERESDSLKSSDLITINCSEY